MIKAGGVFLGVGFDWALITNPPKAGRPMWVFVRKAMFCKGAATPGLNKVGGIMIKAVWLRAL